jgi:L-aspartate oxidase
VSATGFDLLVVGSGVAGLSAAIHAAGLGLRVAVVTKAELPRSATEWAQGGVAAVLDPATDSVEDHLDDTLRAGAGLCDVEATRVLVSDGPARVRELMALGARFDRDPTGGLLLAREGGHGRARVVHTGTATGAEIERTLVAATVAAGIATFEGRFLDALIVEHGRCRGVVVVEPDGSVVELRAPHTLLASGGAGQLFAVTTNPAGATGDGIAAALRAGVVVADLEFVQFHPTALHTDRMPRPLLSEALRGHGALLLDARGERFVDELEPRDVVARAMTARMLEQGVEHLWLDATGLEDFRGRFTNIAETLDRVGIDPSRDRIPVAPAAHYTCGGVLTDVDGATTLPGCWAAGEVACSGVHGANRLASNSLLDGLVFGTRIVDAIAAGVDGPRPTGAMRGLLEPDGAAIPVFPVDLPPSATGGVGHRIARPELQRQMARNGGMVRTEGSLQRLATVLAGAVPEGEPGTGRSELANLLLLGRALAAAATARRETRGAHTRADHPATSDALRVRFAPTPTAP